MTDYTAEKIRITLLAVEALRLVGQIGEEEEVSPGRLARISKQLGCPVDEKTFRSAEASALARARYNHAQLALRAHHSQQPQPANPES